MVGERHERHFPVREDGVQGAGMKFAAALTLRSVTVDPQANNNPEKPDRGAGYGPADRR
jgi:hypothetical protein